MNNFDSIKLKVASSNEILSWSHGEVTKPETINYRTQKPEKDGLFDERIFGPSKDWECYCGKYRRIRYKGVVCDKCGVEVTRSIVRRERMGHIKLAVPVAHIWFLRSVPSKIGLMLDMPLGALERVIYYASYVITKVDEEARLEALKEIEREFKAKFKNEKTESKEAFTRARDKARDELKNLSKYQVLSEIDFHDLSLKYGNIFEAGMGGGVVKKMLDEIDLRALAKQLEQESESAPISTKKKILKRMKLVRGMIVANIRPEWMFVEALPVLPPDLRPMVALDGGRYATSDLNDLYRRVINRNNRLKKLLELKAPEIITRNEKRMLQEAVDALIDNSARRGQGAQASQTAQKRPLRSLADMLKGKQGRFRQNLLGKRVDYSGRSVIVVGPELKLHQCGLPKRMALELFKPFVISKLIAREMAHNIRGANRLIEEGVEEVWAILEEIIKNKLVLLNRAPTLHRLGVQAFQPVLVEGLAIQVHPMVCSAFNADFDGDQMAVHVPLSEEAQTEAREIMLSSRNLLKPATGVPIAVPTQDSVLGTYYLTKVRNGLKGEGKIFSDSKQAVLAYKFGEVTLQAKVKVRLEKVVETSSTQALKKEGSRITETSAGRIIFNESLPDDFEYVNRELNSKALKALIGILLERYGIDKTAVILDKVKQVGFEYSTKSGISWGMNDLTVPKEKQEIFGKAEKEIALLKSHYDRGLLTADERHNRMVEIWKGAIDKIEKLVPKTLDPNGSVYSIISSGARGSWKQPTQMAGLKGLVQNPAGDIIDLPIKSSFKEGFNVLEYFISTHGARKGTADTALRTASAGYLTRRLVDVSQDVVVREVDCGALSGVTFEAKEGDEFGMSLGERAFGRTVLGNVLDPRTGKVLIKDSETVSYRESDLIDQNAVTKITLRSPMACKARTGICQKCYGHDLGSNQPVKVGSAVGVVAAQAIGEPGTQLTMRTFHTGGVATAGDITGGLPRVEEIFEARIPRGKAVISEVRGRVVEIVDKGKQKIVRIASESPVKPEDTKKTKTLSTSSRQAAAAKSAAEIKEYLVPQGISLMVIKDDLVSEGQQLSEGHLDLKELFEISGEEPTQHYVLNEIQGMYSNQGSDINAKHIELIIRQMFSRVRIKDAGATRFIQGEIIEKSLFEEENAAMQAQGLPKATMTQLLMGITKVALTTESFLSSASFQETARVLINAATAGKDDKLRGLKENVIIGKLIPAGTGLQSRSSL